jgi:endonuclease/exonuclease/phosphatase family metal-dependent hydrolase
VRAANNYSFFAYFDYSVVQSQTLESNSSKKCRSIFKYMKIASFNILAPCWAHPKYYVNHFTDQLDTEYRRPRIKRLITALANDGVDLFFLQETQPAEIDNLFGTNGLDPNQWHAYQVAHAPTYWQNWWITDPAELAVAPWTANHTEHGVALLAKKRSFTDVTFSRLDCSTGNAQAVMQATYQGKPFKAICIHYDSDSAANRKVELETTLAVAGNAIIGGDFNFDPTSGNLQGAIQQAGFVDLQADSAATHPFSSNYYRSYNWASIDHFIGRGFETVSHTTVIDHDLFRTFPIKPPPDPEFTRISSNFDLVGSDHFPIIASTN